MDRNRFDAYASEAQDVARLTGRVASRFGHWKCTSAHLFLSLVLYADPALREVFNTLSIDTTTTAREVTSLLKAQPQRRPRYLKPGETVLSEELKDAILEAKRQAQLAGRPKISPHDLLLALATCQDSAPGRRRAPLGRLLQGLGLTPESIRRGIREAGSTPEGVGPDTTDVNPPR